MTDGKAGVSRRGFMQAAAGGAALGVAGTASAQEDNESSGGGEGGGGELPDPDYGGWFGDVPNFDGTEDMRGQDEVEVTVGGEGNNNLSFSPPAIHVSPETTIRWVWSGEGGAHNVVDDGGGFESELTGEQGFEYTQTLEEQGITKYYCDPHLSSGMKGAIVVGEEYASASGGEGGLPGIPDAARTLGVATLGVMTATLALAYVFVRYGGAAPTPE